MHFVGDKYMAGAFLNALSYFSFLRGVLSPSDICRMAKTMGYDRVALVDRDNLCALPEFLFCCREYDLVPIIGAEIIDKKKMKRSAQCCSSPWKSGS